MWTEGRHWSGRVGTWEPGLLLSHSSTLLWFFAVLCSARRWWKGMRWFSNGHMYFAIFLCAHTSHMLEEGLSYFLSLECGGHEQRKMKVMACSSQDEIIKARQFPVCTLSDSSLWGKPAARSQGYPGSHVEREAWVVKSRGLLPTSCKEIRSPPKSLSRGSPKKWILQIQSMVKWHSPSWWLDYNLMRDPGPKTPRKTTPGFLSLRNGVR